MSETRLQRKRRKFSEWMASLFKDQAKNIREEYRRKDRDVERRKKAQFKRTPK